nr:MAG TPA: hypothetical protein [Caudoviricetes sp.]DAS91139.1 MAG TPA: hypothetical protein [Caudoviricetes sp.]
MGSYYNLRHNFYICNLHKVILLYLVFLCLSCRYIPFVFLLLYHVTSPLYRTCKKYFSLFGWGGGCFTVHPR